MSSDKNEAAPQKKYYQPTYTDEIRKLISDLKYDPKANFRYDRFGYFIFSDEICDEIAYWAVEKEEFVFRFLWMHRSRLTLKENEDFQESSLWNDFQIQFPNWPGFRPERQSQKYKKLLKHYEKIVFSDHSAKEFLGKDFFLDGHEEKAEPSYPWKFSEADKKRIRALKYDPKASCGFEMMSGGDLWTDEFTHEIFSKQYGEDNYTFRFLIAYRNDLYRGDQSRKEDFEPVWNDFKTQFPDWPGFRKERVYLGFIGPALRIFPPLGFLLINLREEYLRLKSFWNFLLYDRKEEESKFVWFSVMLLLFITLGLIVAGVLVYILQKLFGGS